MNDSIFSKNAALNAGVVPATAEELSQRYVKLFQQYNRLKAQHAVLKKAVIKEQASNATLQGDLKGKEKELRKLQEQLDLLAFHNERLTKRIQAVQDSDQQKGSHFSLLGGSMKKELEKNTKALDEAKMDLERKIEENEKLHEELNERQFEFTQSINELLKQIQDLETKIQELQEENANLQQEKQSAAITPDISAEDIKKEEQRHNDECQRLQKEVKTLKEDLDRKSKLLDDKNTSNETDQTLLASELQSLRAILLAKVGKTQDPKLYDHIPTTSTALKNFEEQATAYFQSIKNDGDTPIDVQRLSTEIAEKLALSSDTFYTEMDRVSQQLEAVEKELQKMKKEKEEYSTREKELEANIQQQNDKITDLMQKIELDQQNHEASIVELQKKIEDLENSNSQLETELVAQRSIADSSRQELEKMMEKITAEKPSLNKEVQANISIEPTEQEDLKKEARIEQEESNSEKDAADDDSEVFVYPAPTTEAPSEPRSNSDETGEAGPEDKEEEEEEVFVYRGMDAPKQEEKVLEQPAETLKSNNSSSESVNETADTNQQELHDSKLSKVYDEDEMLLREEKLKSYYEQKVKTLTEKIQMTDSKALRFAAMYRSLKDRLVSERKEKDMMLSEIERLNKDVKKVQDLLSTTETNYQTQIDTMTEFITSLQNTVEDLSRNQPPSQPTQANRKYNNNINNINHLSNNNLH